MYKLFVTIGPTFSVERLFVITRYSDEANGIILFYQDGDKDQIRKYVPKQGALHVLSSN